MEKKTIVVNAYPNDMQVKCEIESPSNGVRIFVGDVETNKVQVKHGKVEFRLSGDDTLAPDETNNGTDEIKLKFSLIDKNNNAVLEVSETWNVKNNSNTILSEVINGEAVFVYDTTDDEKHKGITLINV